MHFCEMQCEMAAEQETKILEYKQLAAIDDKFVYDCVDRWRWYMGS